MTSIRLELSSAFMWIFGYGSIIWKPNFEYVERLSGVIRGWDRRFYQHSVRHRGTRKDPGRVATLVPDVGSQVWGAAYRVTSEKKDNILKKLDHRERDGYVRETVSVYAEPSSDSEPIVEEAFLYLADETNPNWAGPASPEQIAEEIRGNSGISGKNIDYVFELADALRAMDARDSHVFAIEEKLVDQSA